MEPQCGVSGLRLHWHGYHRSEVIVVPCTTLDSSVDSAVDSTMDSTVDFYYGLLWALLLGETVLWALRRDVDLPSYPNASVPQSSPQLSQQDVTQ